MIKVLIGFFCVLVITTPCFAEMREQQQKLFKINIPEGWSYEEKADSFSIRDPEKQDGISIVFSPLVAQTEDEALLKLEQGLSVMAVMMYRVSPDIKETQIDNVKALQLDYIWPEDPDKSQFPYNSHVSCYYNGLGYQINYGSKDFKEKALMEETVRSFRFEKK